MIKIQWLASIWRQNDQNVELRRKTFKTKLNYKSDQNPMTCIDLTSKRSKCWVTSQNIQNKAKLQKWSKSNDLHRFDVKTIKMLSYVAIQNKAKLQKWSKSNDCIDLTSKRSKCWVTSQNIQNKAKLQTKSTKVIKLHRFDVKTINNVELRRKTFKTTLNYKHNDLHRFDDKTIKTTQNMKAKLHRWIASIWRQNDQNVELRRKTFKTKLQKWSPMTCIDLTSKRSKCWVTSQNIQNKAKLQKWSKSNDLHRFDVKTIKMFYVAKQNIQNKAYESDQNPMTCIDLTSKRSKCWVTSQNIQNKAKLQKWSKYNDLHRFDQNDQIQNNDYKSDQISNDLHRFDVKTIKMLSYVAKHSKQS